MSLDTKITVDASGALTGVATLNATIASIGESLSKLNTDLGKTKQAFDSLENKLTSTLRTARDAALSLGKAANDTTSAVQKAVSGLASIDSALEKRVQRVRDLRKELQDLSGTSLAGGPTGPGSRGGGNGVTPPPTLARLGDFSSLPNFLNQLERQFGIILQSRAFFFLKDQIFQAAEAAKELNARITEIQTISQTAGRSTDSWAQSLIKVSNELGRPVAEVADAAYQALSNNIRNADGNTERFLTTVGNFARVTRTSFPGAVDAVSSVLNSYRQSITESDNVTSKLFKGIELGRFRGEELANALGKTAPIASQLGVSLDELLGAFVTLTDQGQSLNTASTLTLNIFNALLKPSQALTQLYAKQGVSSGQEFIQVNNGLAGVLQILADKSQGATKEITDLVSNIRGTRGIIGITSDIRRFAESIGDIKNSKASFEVALQLEDQSVNRALDKFGQRLKNQAIQSLGDGILSAFAAVGKLDERTGIVQNLIPVGTDIGLTLIVAKTAQILTNLTLGRIEFSALAQLTSPIAAGVGLITQNIFAMTAAATATFVVFEKIFSQSQQQIDAIETANKLIRERSALGQRSPADVLGDTAKRADTALTIIQRRSADARASIIRDFEQSRQNVRTSFEQLAGSMASFFDRTRQTIQETNRDISRNLNEIDNSRKSLGDFRASLEKGFINFKLDLADPIQKLRILADESERLRAKGAALIVQGAQAKGTEGEDLIRQGRDELAEANNLIKQRAQVLAQISREQGGSISSTQLLNQLEQDSLAILNSKTNAERALQSIKAEQVKQLRLQQENEKENLKRLELSFKEFSEIQNKIAEGTITKDKKFIVNGVFDPQLVRREITDIGSKLSQAIFKIDPAAAARFAADLGKSAFEAQNAISKAIADKKAEARAEELIKDKAAIAAQASAIKELNDKIASSFNAQNDPLNKGEGLADASRLINLRIGELQRGGSISDGTTGQRQEAIAQLKDIIDLVNRARQSPVNKDGLLLISPETTIQLQAAEQGLSRIVQLNKTLLGPSGTVTLNKAKDEIGNLLGQQRDLQTLVDVNKSTVSKVIDLAQSGAEGFDSALKNLTTVTTEGANTVATALENLSTRIDRILANTPVTGGNFSHGGTVPAGQGMDTVLAGLRPGEIVMNPTASRLFASQLQAMNSLSSIPYGQGGNVSVGDVNVYVSGSNTSEQNVREIGRGIRRELRRGNLRF